MLLLYYLTIFALTYFLVLLTSIPMMRVYSISIIARVVKANIWVFDCALNMWMFNSFLSGFRFLPNWLICYIIQILLEDYFVIRDKDNEKEEEIIALKKGLHKEVIQIA